MQAPFVGLEHGSSIITAPHVLEMTWQVSSSGEWSLDGRHLTERMNDMKSFLTEVRINDQPVDVITISRR
jgi:hypothetical protein